MLRPIYITREEEATSLPVTRNQLIHGNRNSFNNPPKAVHCHLRHLAYFCHTANPFSYSTGGSVPPSDGWMDGKSSLLFEHGNILCLKAEFGWI